VRYQLLVLDVDGTLLDSQHHLRPRVTVAVRAACAAGLSVVLATGKLLASVAPLLDTFGVAGPQIVLNGAATLDSGTGDALRFCPLEEGLRRRVLALVRAADPDVLISQFALDTIYVGVDQREHPLLGVFAAYGEGPPVVVPDLDATTLPACAKILLSGKPERLAVLRAALALELPAGVSMTTTTPDFLEFFDVAAGKGQALGALRKTLGIAKEAVVAIGDGENDAPLLREAGLPIAMANGAAVTRAAATRIAPSNDEEGVAVVLEALLAERTLAP
jgi:Cof subfamily protein (haloacid dehalogenase superfamily)